MKISAALTIHDGFDFATAESKDDLNTEIA